jgi:hypothetical protein
MSRTLAGANLRLLLDTTPQWLGLTLVCSACALVTVGIGVLLGQIAEFSITPFTLLLHFVTALALSSWVLSFKIKISREKKPVLAVGVAIAIGSIWSSLQQWLAYVATGLASDITMVVGAMLMDAAGGCATYILFQLNVLRK